MIFFTNTGRPFFFFCLFLNIASVYSFSVSIGIFSSGGGDFLSVNKVAHLLPLFILFLSTASIAHSPLFS